MKIVFEDKRESLVCKLYLHSYCEDESVKFIFTNGNGKIEK